MELKFSSEEHPLQVTKSLKSMDHTSQLQLWSPLSISELRRSLILSQLSFSDPSKLLLSTLTTN